MNNVNADTLMTDLDAQYNKIELLFTFLSVHVNQIMALTENYINQIQLEDGEAIYGKKRFFELIEVKADYAECVINLKNVLGDEALETNECKISLYRHQLVTQIARGINSSKRWSRLLLMYQNNNDDKYIGLWRESMKRFEKMAYLDFD